jgi:hypothetical protein
MTRGSSLCHLSSRVADPDPRKSEKPELKELKRLKPEPWGAVYAHNGGKGIGGLQTSGRRFASLW